MKDKELEDEIKRLGKLENPNKSDIEYQGRLISELKGRKEARKELLEEVKEILKESELISGKDKSFRYAWKHLKDLEKKLWLILAYNRLVRMGIIFLIFLISIIIFLMVFLGFWNVMILLIFLFILFFIIRFIFNRIFG